MAINSTPLVVQGTRGAPKRINATRRDVKTFAASSGAAFTMGEGTLLAFNTSTNLWVPWATGGANGTGTIRGIVPSGVTIDIPASGGGEVLGLVMTQGDAWWEDLIAVGAETAAQIAAALQYSPSGDASLRSMGIEILGLDMVR